MLAHREIASASVKEIVREAGMSSRSFYEHFASKDEIFLELVAVSSEVFLERFETALRGDGTAIEVVEDALDVYLEDLVPVAAMDRKRLGEATWLQVEALRSRILNRIIDQILERIVAARADGLPIRVPERTEIELVLLGVEGLTLRYGREDRTEEIQEARPAIRGLLLSVLGFAEAVPPA